MTKKQMALLGIGVATWVAACVLALWRFLVWGTGPL